MKRLIGMVLMALLCGRMSAEAACVAGDTVAPAKIVDAKVQVVSSEGMIYQFTAPPDQSTLASYDVRWRAGTPITALNFASSTQVTGEPTPSVSGTIEHLNLTTLTPNTTYYMALKVTDACGKTSVMSNAITFTTLATPSKIRVVFYWKPNAVEDQVTGYRLYYGPKSYYDDPTWAQDPYTVDVGNVTTTEVTLDPGTYYFRIKAYNTTGLGPFSNEVSIP